MRRFGQHFLKNKAAAKKIAAALELKPGETVIEIGPGHGELTDEIFNSQFSRLRRSFGGQAIFNKIKLVAIEKDVELAEILKNKFSADKNIEIIQGDALKVIPSLIHNSSFIIHGYKIVGNIPYYITGHLLRTIGELENKPELCVFTIQKEVAERIAAKSPRMNKLAASVQFWAEPKILGHIPRGDFSPPPEVDSAIIKLKVKSEKLKVNAEKYYKTVKILFQQPRKTILNNVEAGLREVKASRRGLLPKKQQTIKRLLEIGINPQDRPQNLSVEDIIKISELLT
jgi:16S rRNA (adenine1518-N6/adenine1519-N6)-dimethyltransferase